MERNQLLTECLRRQLELADCLPPPEWKYWLVESYQNEILHGPEYRPGDWFGGDMPNYIRQRYLRAIEGLEKDGLLVSWKRNGCRLTHVKLTDSGEQIAKTLLERDMKNASTDKS